MDPSKKVEKLREDSLKLFKLRDNPQEYGKKANAIVDKVHDFKLEHEIDSGELMFVLMNPVKGKDRSLISLDEFRKSIEEYFESKETDYYFQLVELSDFPKKYNLGHGTLLPPDSLPKQVKVYAENLAKGKVTSVVPATQKVWKWIISKLVIPEDPQVGHWLKISVSAISSTKRLNRAFENAEESLDILRMAISAARFHLPQYAIALDKGKTKAYAVVKGVEFSRYVYNKKNHQKIIDTLNAICVSPSSDLERRIKNAIHFYRLADNSSPDHQKLFFYVAAIENLILGGNDRDVLRWKFSEKGAILLSNDPKERLDLAEELKRVYDKRSKTAHGGKSDYDYFSTKSSRSYLRRIIMMLMYLISKDNLRTITRDKKNPGQSLDEYLNNIIFSG